MSTKEYCDLWISTPCICNLETLQEMLIAAAAWTVHLSSTKLVFTLMPRKEMLASQLGNVCDKAGALQWLNVPQAAHLDMILYGSECWSMRHCSCKPCTFATMVPKLACVQHATSGVVLLNKTADTD